MTQDLSDEDLMQPYPLGEIKAFDTLYGRYSAKVYGYLFKRLSSRALVDDIHQTTFLKLHEARRLYKRNLPRGFLSSQKM
jgi:DNA-directed RNA polymerase specialized sigma24 family protein